MPTRIVCVLLVFLLGTAGMQALAQGKKGALDLSVFGGYYPVELEAVNAAYADLEKQLKLDQGKDFETKYYASAAGRYWVSQGNAFDAEIGGILFKDESGGTVNYMQLFYAGIGYSYHYYFSPFSAYAGVGLGHNWLKTERTYKSAGVSLKIQGSLWQIQPLAGIEYSFSGNASLAIEGKYVYATSLEPQRDNRNLWLRGPMVGIRFSLSIL